MCTARQMRGSRWKEWGRERITAYWIADRPERFASPWPAEKTAKMLRAQQQYEMLKAFHLWPFGDLGAESKE